MKEIRHSWKQLASVQLGGVICLPIFFVGYMLAKNYGLTSAILAIIIGNLILLLMACTVVFFSAEHRKSTAQYAVDLFGSKGKCLFTGIIVLSMIAWFAIQLNILALSLQSLLKNSLFSSNLLIGLLITLVGTKGVRALTMLASISMPVLIFTIGYAIFQVSDSNIIVSNDTVVFSGISMIIATAIAAIIDLPTFFRTTKGKKDSIIAVCILFGIALPLIEGVGVYLFMHNQGENFVEILMGASSSHMWKGWIALFLLLAGWTTNSANLYSASVSFEVIASKLSMPLRVIFIGITGTLISCFNILDNMAIVLDGMGIILGSIGAIMIIHFISKGAVNRNMNFIALALGIIGGIFSVMGYSITGIHVLDSFLFALIFAAGNCFYKKIRFFHRKNIIARNRDEV
ncbi:MAG: hypothetical protein ACFFG0_20900 [Candidatus Thorarchaeota archaeon]